MAVKRFFNKNKEIFMPRPFAETGFPYLFLLVSLCSPSQSFVQYEHEPRKLYGFDTKNPMVFSGLLLMVSLWYHGIKNPCKARHEDGPRAPALAHGNHTKKDLQVTADWQGYRALLQA